MRALILVDRLAVIGAGNGKEHISTNLVRAHRRLGYDVDVYVNLQPLDEAREAAEALGAAYVDVGDAAGPAGRPRWERTVDTLVRGRLAARRRVRQVVPILEERSRRIGSYDLVVVCALGDDDLAAIAQRVGRSTGAPCVLWEHRSQYNPGRLRDPVRRLWLRASLSSAASVVAVSEPLADLIRKKLRLPHLDVRIVPNMVTRPFFEPERDGDALEDDELTTLSAWRGDRFTFVGCQNWARPLKRFDLLLEAFGLAHARDAEIALVVVGPVPDDAEARVEEAGLGGAVSLHGRVPHDRIPAFVSAGDAAIMTSDSETFGIPAAEALAMGKPVVTTRCGGPESFIEDGVHGFTVPRGDAAALADAMLRVKGERASFDPAALGRYARNRFSFDAFCARWEDVHRVVPRTASADRTDR